MAIISFEKIAPDGMGGVVPDGFRRLNWDNFVAIDNEYLESLVGNTNAIRTGEAAAINEARSISFKSFDRDDDFDLNNGYFTALIADSLADNIMVKVLGFDDGERVAKKVLTLETNQEFVRFGPHFDDIDEVRFTVKTDSTFGIDDLFVA